MCVLPTSTIGYWICHPQTAGSWERAIQAQLGVTTRIDSVETPGPFVTILRNLRFLDLDGETLFRAVETKIEFGGKYNQIIFPGKVRGLTSEGLAFLVDSIEKNVIHKRSAEKHWIVVFEENTTLDKTRSSLLLGSTSVATSESSINPIDLSSRLTVSELTIEIGPTLPKADGAYAKARFKIFDPIKNQVAEKFVTCDLSKTDQYGHVMELNTNESALPCWLITHPSIDLQSTIGRNATFNGALQFKPTSTLADVELVGVFENVDLVTAVSVVSQNTASIQLNKCKFESGKLVNWDALLYLDSESPKPIDEKYLFTYSRKLDIAGALTKAWLEPTPRSVNRD